MTDRPTVPAISFLSDYGTADEFVGLVHAVLHRRAPEVTAARSAPGSPGAGLRGARTR